MYMNRIHFGIRIVYISIPFQINKNNDKMDIYLKISSKFPLYISYPYKKRISELWIFFWRKKYENRANADLSSLT